MPTQPALIGNSHRETSCCFVYLLLIKSASANLDGHSETTGHIVQIESSPIIRCINYHQPLSIRTRVNRINNLSCSCHQGHPIHPSCCCWCCDDGINRAVPAQPLMADGHPNSDVLHHNFPNTRVARYGAQKSIFLAWRRKQGCWEEQRPHHLIQIGLTCFRIRPRWF